VLLEVLAGPRTFAGFFASCSRATHSNPSASIDPTVRRTPPAVRSFIEMVAKATHEAHHTVGSGRDVRFEDDGISGCALIGERGVVPSGGTTVSSSPPP
jgi:hypothetical protein